MKSYEEIYNDYVSYCTKIGSPSLSFENWMYSREDNRRAKPRFSDILRGTDDVLVTHE